MAIMGWQLLFVMIFIFPAINATYDAPPQTPPSYQPKTPPQGYSPKPSPCQIVYKDIKKVKYEEKIEQKCHFVTVTVAVDDTKTECDQIPKEECDAVWVCLDYPPQENINYCHNKKWQSTDYGCKTFYTEHCHDVPWTRYEDHQKEECKEIHKRIPIQTTERVPYRQCPNQPDHPMSEDEMKEYQTSSSGGGYQTSSSGGGY